MSLLSTVVGEFNPGENVSHWESLVQVRMIETMSNCQPKDHN